MKPDWRPAISLVICLSLSSALSACASLAPARYPPHIRNTPGAFVVVTDRQFDAGIYRLELPPAWTLVKSSPANAEYMHVIFSAPDGGRVSLLQVESGDASDPDLLTLPNGIKLQVSIETAESPSSSFVAHAQLLVSSIRS